MPDAISKELLKTARDKFVTDLRNNVVPALDLSNSESVTEFINYINSLTPENPSVEMKVITTYQIIRKQN